MQKLYDLKLTPGPLIRSIEAWNGIAAPILAWFAENLPTVKVYDKSVYGVILAKDLTDEQRALVMLRWSHAISIFGR
jgi:hypothetical protein